MIDNDGGSAPRAPCLLPRILGRQSLFPALIMAALPGIYFCRPTPGLAMTRAMTSGKKHHDVRLRAALTAAQEKLRGRADPPRNVGGKERQKSVVSSRQAREPSPPAMKRAR